MIGQLRKVSLVIAAIAGVFAFISGAVVFFVVEPPFLVSIFVACAAIALGCFVIAAVAAYLEEE